MKENTEKTEAGTAYGVNLKSPIPYGFSWTTYENFAELQAKKDELTEEEQVDQRNRERKSKARAEALTAALTAAGHIKPTNENSAQVRLKDMFKTLMNSKKPGTDEPKYTTEEARALAADLVGEAWAE